MADKNINTATSATAIATGDSLLVSKSNTTLQKIDYNLLAKAIIEQYTDSTLANNNQTLKQAIDALNRSVKAALTALNSNYVYVLVVDASSAENGFQQALKNISDKNLTINKTYPVMLYFAVRSPGFSGSYTGTCNITDGGIRFFVSDENDQYFGLYLRSTGVLSKLIKSPSRAEMDTTTGIAHTKGDKVNYFITNCRKHGAICFLSGYMDITSKLSTGDILVSLAGITAAVSNIRIPFFRNNGSGEMFFAKIDSGSNQIVADSGLDTTAAGNYYVFNFVIPIG